VQIAKRGSLVRKSSFKDPNFHAGGDVRPAAALVGTHACTHAHAAGGVQRHLLCNAQHDTRGREFLASLQWDVSKGALSFRLCAPPPGLSLPQLAKGLSRVRMYTPAERAR
jgi:hypothetical protein